LEEWDDEDTFGPAKTEEDDSKAVNKNSRVVVLKHMFTLQELEEDATLLLDLKEDVREECESLGEVTNVVLYDVSLSPLWRCDCETEQITARIGGNHDHKVP
jgi:HIV Tat-specific factor 1